MEVQTPIKRKRVHNSRRTLRTTTTTSGNNENAGHRHTLRLGRRFLRAHISRFVLLFFPLFISPFPTWSVALDSTAARLLRKRGRKKNSQKKRNRTVVAAKLRQQKQRPSTAQHARSCTKPRFHFFSLLFLSLVSTLAYQTQPPRSKQAMAWQVASLSRLRCFVFFVLERPLLLAQLQHTVAELQRRTRLPYRRVAKHQPHVSHLFYSPLRNREFTSITATAEPPYTGLLESTDSVGDFSSPTRSYTTRIVQPRVAPIAAAASRYHRKSSRPKPFPRASVAAARRKPGARAAARNDDATDAARATLQARLSDHP